MNKHYIKNILLMVMVSGSFAACSLKDPKQAYNISVALPNSSSSSAKYSSTLGTSASVKLQDIQTLAAAQGFRCFALNIVGSDIASDSRFGCNDATMGKMIGMGAISGSTLSGDVLAGSGRKIQLLGAKFSPKSTIQGCPSFESLLSSSTNLANPGQSFDGLDVYKLGEVTTDVFSDVSVTITADFNTTTKMFNNCGNGNNGGKGGFNINFNPSPLANMNYSEQVLLSGAPNPGSFQVNGGVPPYQYTHSLSAPASAPGTLTISPDTASAVYIPSASEISVASTNPVPNANGMNGLSLTLIVTDSSNPPLKASTSVVISGMPTQAKLFGPFAAARGACIPFQLASADTNGFLAFNTSAMNTSSALIDNLTGGNAGTFYYNPNCSIPAFNLYGNIPAQQVNGTLGTYPVVYYQNYSAAVSSINFSIPTGGQFILAGIPNNYGFQMWSVGAPGLIPTTIASGQCVNAGIQLLLRDATNNSTSDASTRTLTLKGTDPTTNFYYDANCTQLATSDSLNPFQTSTGGYFLKTGLTTGSATWSVSDQFGVSGTLTIPVGAVTSSARLTSANMSTVNTLTLGFNEVMTSIPVAATSSALNPSNYVVSSINTYDPINAFPSGVSVAGNGTTYNLAWQAGSFCPGDRITVNNVLDIIGNPIASAYNSIQVTGNVVPPNAPTYISAAPTNNPLFNIIGSFSVGDVVKVYTSAPCTGFPMITTGFASNPSSVQFQSNFPPSSGPIWMQVTNKCGQKSSCFNFGNLNW